LSFAYPQAEHNRHTILVLGSPDPEMEAIECVARKRNIRYVYATDANGNRVSGRTMYEAASCTDLLSLAKAVEDAAFVVFVECRPSKDFLIELGKATLHFVDHHREGDAGYGKEYDEYWEASSIGQVCNLLGEPQTVQLSIIAAADHCLQDAYAGKCPGVQPDHVALWRAQSRANFQKRNVLEVLQDIEDATNALKRAPFVNLSLSEFGAHTVLVRDMRGEKPVRELVDASMLAQIPYIAGPMVDKATPKLEKYVVSGPPNVIKTFKEQFAPSIGLVNIYGDPARGMGGGYRVLE